MVKATAGHMPWMEVYSNGMEVQERSGGESEIDHAYLLQYIE